MNADYLLHFNWFDCRDGRIKVIGGDGIEALFTSPKQLPYKNIEVIILTTYVEYFCIFNWNFDARYHLEYYFFIFN